MEVTVYSVSYRIIDGKVGDMMLLGWESIWQKSAKFEGGNLSLGVGNPRFPTLCMKQWYNIYLYLYSQIALAITCLTILEQVRVLTTASYSEVCD